MLRSLLSFAALSCAGIAFAADEPVSPKEATRANIEKLTTAGLDDRDIVTLAGLIAFVNYQVLVVAGLKMLRDN